MSNSLYIFDFDDTLVDSGANVKVVRSDGTEDLYTSREYRDYDRKYKRPGDVLNFDEFDVDPPNASVIKGPWNAFIKSLQSVGPRNVMILTARANPIPVKDFLVQAGIDPLPAIEAVGDSETLYGVPIMRLWKDEPED